MPKKRTSTGAERVVETLDHKALDTLLQEANFPPQNYPLAHERLDKFIAVVRVVERDTGITADAQLKLKRAQKVAEEFKKSAKALSAIVNQLALIDAPRQRHRNDPNSEFYVPEVGANQLQDALTEALAKIYSPTFLVSFGFTIGDFFKVAANEGGHPPLRDPFHRTNQSLKFDEEALRSALATQATPLTRAIVNQLALGLFNAAETLMPHQKRGGAAPNPIRDLILPNIIQLWYEGFEGKKGIYVDETYRDLLNFAQQICSLLGVPSYSSEYHVKAAITRWKNLSG